MPGPQDLRPVVVVRPEHVQGISVQDDRLVIRVLAGYVKSCLRLLTGSAPRPDHRLKRAGREDETAAFGLDALRILLSYKFRRPLHRQLGVARDGETVLHCSICPAAVAYAVSFHDEAVFVDARRARRIFPDMR